MKNKIFYFTCFGFIAGVFLASHIIFSLSLVLFASLLSFMFVLYFSAVSYRKGALLCFCFLLALSLGAWRFGATYPLYPEYFEAKLDEKVKFSGIVVDEPDVRENNQKIVVRVHEGDAETKILVSTFLGEKFQYGDEVALLGKLEKPENFITDQEKEFDYINYLRKDGILYKIDYAEVSNLVPASGFSLQGTLFKIKAGFLEKVSKVIREPESLLLGGLILGERATFSAEMRQDFIDTGTIHIVALSGYNVTIVAEWIIKIFQFLPRNIGLSFGALGIVLFVLMSGGLATAVRAGVMALLALLARSTGRLYDVGRGLLMASVGMIFFNPMILVYDVSFQLSVVATIAVIFLAPRWQKYFSWVTESFGLRDIVSVTFSAYIFVLPIILYKMGNFSLTALPANILVLPFIPATMFFGFFTGFVGVFSYILSIPIGYFAYLLLHYELGVIKTLAGFTWSAFTVSNFPLILVLGFYIYFAYYLFRSEFKKIFTFNEWS